MAAAAPPRGGGGAAVAQPTMPPPRPKSPPEYPDGRRREVARVQMLEREIGFLEAELKLVQGIQPASKYCKEVSDFVVANSDPLIPVQKKSRSPCRFWKWLRSGVPCLNLLSFFCCCQSECLCHLRRPECCSHDCCKPNCSCPSCPSCLSCSGCCQIPSCGSCPRGCSCSCCSSCSDMKPCCCIPRRCWFSCQWLSSCPKLSSCCRCRCRCRGSSCFRCPKIRLCCCNCRNLCSNPCCLAF